MNKWIIVTMKIKLDDPQCDCSCDAIHDAMGVLARDGLKDEEERNKTITIIDIDAEITS